jgi:hypothetical protein
MALVYVSLSPILFARGWQADLTLNGINDAIFQKIELFITTDVSTSDLT